MTRLHTVCLAACLFVCLAAAPMPKLSGDPETHPTRGDFTSSEDLVVETTRNEIEAVLGNKSIPRNERRKRIDKILDALPTELFGRLPLPTQMYRLPEEVIARIEHIHQDPKLTVRQKRQRIRHPPAGFEQVLDANIMEELLAIHANETLTIAEKKLALDEILQALPKDVIDRLPLPILMRQLPADIQARLQALIYNPELPWDARVRATRKYVRTLPKQFRRLLRPSKSSAYSSNDQKDAQDKSHRSFLPYANEGRFDGMVDDIKPKLLSSLGFTIEPVIRRRSTFWFY
ncbi:hypothetical protein M3Y99_01827100 [Aphelenchoides fujianensis]|nr:hypothetical protein M3Y99_01827100 [Aphelenchoides fujianensis]